jgi:hypothetical protein
MIGLRSIGLAVGVVIVGVALFQRATIAQLNADKDRLQLSVDALTEQSKRIARAAVLEAKRAAHMRTLVADRDAALSEIREGNFADADTPLDPDLARILNRVRP